MHTNLWYGLSYGLKGEQYTCSLQSGARVNRTTNLVALKVVPLPRESPWHRKSSRLVDLRCCDKPALKMN